MTTRERGKRTKRMFAAFNGGDFRGVVRWQAKDVREELVTKGFDWSKIRRMGFSIRPVLVTWAAPKPTNRKAKRK